MSKFIVLILSCIVFVACNKNGNNMFVTMPPELDSVLNEYMFNNPQNRIYYLIFEERCNKQFFTLQCSSTCYDSGFMDGCFMKNDKIIVFWSVNNSWKDSLLHIQEEGLCYDSLSKYTDLAQTDIINDASYNPQTYRIISVNKYRKADESDWAYPEQACDSNIIISSALNKIVNDYINTYNSPNIVYLRFNNINGVNYVSIGHDYVYDPESFSGMFYRNERIVVLYAIDKIKDMDIIDVKSLLSVQAIRDYKSKKRNIPQFSELKYRINSKEIIEPISVEESNWINI